MKIAAFGDVHGNRHALEAIVRDIGWFTPDVWVNLGDSLYGGADPAGAWSLLTELRERHHLVEVRGNTDERLGTPLAEVTEKRRMLEWLHSVLPRGAGEFVGALPLTRELADGEVLVAHGS
uniref:metallophosphoesterase family protein n=1 Tax=Deinococcus pimensis TaxID=309888 RepID=UPI00048596C2